MNHFELRGTIEVVEENRSTKGRTYYRIILATGGELIPLVVFRRVSEGDRVTIEGRITVWNSYPQLRVESVSQEDCGAGIDPVGNPRRQEPICTVGPGEDLPF